MPAARNCAGGGFKEPFFSSGLSYIFFTTDRDREFLGRTSAERSLSTYGRIRRVESKRQTWRRAWDNEAKNGGGTVTRRLGADPVSNAVDKAKWGAKYRQKGKRMGERCRSGGEAGAGVQRVEKTGRIQLKLSEQPG